VTDKDEKDKPPERDRPAPACPICGKPVDLQYKPFCSKRCANVDLHRWLKNSYSIAGAPLDDESSEQ
jgi:endogenous inhibitor of DNA gyrase (YacG/DUF329 family)